MARDGRQSPITFEAWWADQGRVVMDLAGAAHSGWDGNVCQRLESGGQLRQGRLAFAGKAPDPQATGTQPIMLPNWAIGGIELVFDRPAMPFRSQATFVAAMHELVREQARLLRADAHRPAARPESQAGRPSTGILRTGSLELWTGRELGDYVKRSGLNHERRLSLEAVRFEPVPEQHAVSQAAIGSMLAGPLGALDGTLLARLVREPDRQWAAVAEHKLDGDQSLRALVAADPNARAQALATIEQAMREPLDRLPRALARVQGGREVKRAAKDAGQAAAAAGTKAMGRIAAAHDRRGMTHRLGKVFSGVGRAGAQSSGARDERPGGFRKPDGSGRSRDDR